ncbi:MULTISPECIES: TlpA family protein disulfide reductase [Sphingobacterium]|uniref:TlpA family protein disulfide reductase n=1 Tax=Sphingobacterium TaxID=28453 RepID=UPI0013DD7CF1|nr:MULTISPECIES: TlpA disulfide reductase family protein [unclassified Sphingobacterium]
MKKLCILLLICGISFSAMAQRESLIKGVLKYEKTPNLKLYKIEKGKTVEIGVSTPDSLGSFSFSFHPEYEGLYVLATEKSSPIDQWSFWFKEGDELTLSITDSGYELTGKTNSKENVILTKWYHLLKPIGTKTLNEAVFENNYWLFCRPLEEISNNTKSWLKENRSGNKRFDSRLKSIVTVNLNLIANTFIKSLHTYQQYLSYQKTGNYADSGTKNMSPYYFASSVKTLYKSTDDVYLNPFGERAFLDQLDLDRLKDGVQRESGEKGLSQDLSYIFNNTLKGDRVLAYVNRLKDYEEYKSLMNQYGKFIITESQQNFNARIAEELDGLKPGRIAYNFSYEDHTGNIVSMSDLKGKVVLIDVWATWCGPCRAQFPHLKRLKEEFNGQDLVMVGISVDEPKNKDKWRQLIKHENLEGVQLFAKNGYEISQFYKIKSIPRFILIDKEGKIINADTPYPSDPALSILIQDILSN